MAILAYKRNLCNIVRASNGDNCVPGVSPDQRCARAIVDATPRTRLHTACLSHVDAFWKGQLVVEHKSRGQDLDRAFVQALDYFPGIPDRDLPKYVLVSDFARFRLYDVESGKHSEFALKDLHKHSPTGCDR